MTEIKRAQLSDLELLLKWRITVLREVFSITDESVIPELERQNRAYYQTALPAGEHIACFACDNGEIVGCGGVCLYSEMPSPDNQNGKCAYIMNIYVAPEYRRKNIGKAIVTWLLEQEEVKRSGKVYLETSENGRMLYTSLNFVPMAGVMRLGNSTNQKIHKSVHKNM